MYSVLRKLYEIHHNLYVYDRVCVAPRPEIASNESASDAALDARDIA